MAGSIRICLIAEGFTEDLITCVSAITKHTQTPISIYANGKSNWLAEGLFEAQQISVTREKNPLGWGNVINHFLNTFSEDYLVIMIHPPYLLGIQSQGHFLLLNLVIKVWAGKVG